MRRIASSSLGPHRAGLIAWASSLGPHRSGLIARASSLGPHRAGLIARAFLLGSLLFILLPAPPAAAADFADRAWLQPRPEIQMDKDATLVPVGRGAVFVPCMSLPLYEPPYSVYQDGELIGTAPVGTRIVTRPGRYQVVLGTTSGTGRVEREVTVLEGKTAVVEPNWTGLRIQVVDENAVPFRGLYELIALPSMDNLGIGYGAQVQQGEELRTWILEPGLYMILKVGESYQARRNFFTFRIRPGYLEHLALVMDTESGDFLGAGEAPVLSRGSRVRRDLTLSSVIGGGVALSSQSNITGVPDSTELSPSLYLDMLLQYAPKKHYLYGRLNAEEAFTQEDWGRFEKNIDYLRFDGLYAYRLLEYVGPYARLGFESTLFPGFLYFDTPQDVVLHPDYGEQTWPGVEEFRISDPFFPFTLKSGAGLRFNTLPSAWLNVWSLVGVGGRFTFTHGLYRDEDSADTEAHEVVPVDSFEQFGLEGTLVLNMTLSRWVVANTEFEGFAPFDDFTQPTFRWDSNVGLRVTSYVSINYTYRLKHEPELNDNLQHDHQVQLRFSYKFF